MLTLDQCDIYVSIFLFQSSARCCTVTYSFASIPEWRGWSLRESLEEGRCDFGIVPLAFSGHAEVSLRARLGSERLRSARDLSPGRAQCVYSPSAGA
jgi:hypothetical protein